MAQIGLEFDLASNAPAILRTVLPSGKWIVASDRTVSAVLATAIRRNLAVDVEMFLIADAPGNEAPVPDQARVDALQERIRSVAASAVVAVGSGTVNDVAKLAAFNVDIPYAVLATAPSMNGYTSSVASLIVDGCQRFPGRAGPLSPALPTQRAWRLLLVG